MSHNLSGMEAQHRNAAVPFRLQQCAVVSIVEGILEVALQASAGRSGLEVLGGRPALINLLTETAAKGESLLTRYQQKHKTRLRVPCKQWSLMLPCMATKPALAGSMVPLIIIARPEGTRHLRCP